VRILHIRADADSLDLVIRELVDDDTTLETSVDGDELGLSAKHVLEDSAGGLAKSGIRLCGPSWAIRGMLNLLATIESCISNDVVAKSMESLVDRGTGKDLNFKRAVLLEVGDRDRLGGLDKAGDSLAPLPDTVVKTREGLKSSASGREGEALGCSGSSDGLDGELGLNLDLGKLLLETVKDVLHCSNKGISLVGNNRELCSGVRGDGVVSIATVHLGKMELCTSHGDVVLEEHLNNPHGGVGAANLDIATTVATLEVLNVQGVVLESRVLLGAGHGEAEDTINTTSAAESDLSPVLRIDVDEVLGILGKKLALLKAKSTNKTSLLIDGEEDLDGTVLDGLVLGDGKACGNTTAIITTKSGLGGTKKFTIDVRNKRISLKVELKISGLGGNHIKVSLKNNTRKVLLALSGRDSNANIAEFISLHRAAKLLADFLSPSRNLGSVVRRTRNLSQCKEVLPNARAFGILLAKLFVKLLLNIKMQFCHCKSSKLLFINRKKD